jgi:deazaflavin-dependent oxidoreductase (nitroreductase family)
MSVRYDEPHRAARSANALIRWLAELGISIAGSRALRVRGRKTGKIRGVVVNVLTVNDVDYLVSPRGTTQWVRNVRAAGVVEVGPGWHRRRLRATEVADSAKPDLLRRYLGKWYWEVKGHIAGLTPDSGDDELQAAAPSIPVFALANPR